MEPTPFVVCRMCGHEESCGAWMHFEADEDICRRDVAAFVQELHDAGLVRIE